MRYKPKFKIGQVVVVVGFDYEFRRIAKRALDDTGENPGLFWYTFDTGEFENEKNLRQLTRVEFGVRRR